MRRVALLAAAGLIAAGCGSSGTDETLSSRQRADAAVFVHDAPPAQNVSQIFITLTEIQFFRESGSVVEVLGPSDEPLTFDLLAQVQGNQFQIVDERIPAGAYAAVRLAISDAILTFNDGTPDADLVAGTPVTVSIDTPFVVTEGGSVVITLDFDAEASFPLVSGGFVLDPLITVDEIVVSQ